MARVSSSTSFAEYLNVGEAAQFLGVSPATLRNWDRSGKLKPRRHPQNGYRIYLQQDLQAVLSSADVSAANKTADAPTTDWSAMSDSDHFVQFYESDEFLIDSVAGFVRAALTSQNSSVVIATLEHRLALQSRLAADAIDIAAAIEAGRYIVLDAADTLAKFMVDGLPDPVRFNETVGPVIGQLAQGGRRVHAFGEMVALLWSDGNRDAAVRLEQLWNEFGQQHRFALFCAYPIASFGEANDGDSFNGVCGCHSRVIPSESYAAIECADERMRAIGKLQQKAQALEGEIAQRRQVEQVLSNCEREIVGRLDHDADQRQKTKPGAATPNKLPKQRILVVDDNHDACKTLSMLLRFRGHDVRMASDGLQALDVAAEFEPNIVLMDVGMPKLDGFEATRRLRQMPCGKDVFIVALTGWDQSSDRKRSEESGCSAHLVKPVDFTALEQLLAQGVLAS